MLGFCKLQLQLIFEKSNILGSVETASGREKNNAETPFKL